ncbi:MAG: hypothetical protein QFB87_05150 [Patescibacteria group bacterium]|nr:hypothetical protein [Patescibacteria group bacterium]
MANDTLVIRQGKTFNSVLRWGAAPYKYSAIQAITQAAPAVITSALHGVPNGWPVAIVSVKGMEEINSENSPPKAKDYKKATIRDTNTIELNDVNSSGFSSYKSSGYVQYLTPVDLTGFTARMSIKDRLGGTVLATLTTENFGITLDNTAKTITLNITAIATALYTWKVGVSELELVSASGIVTSLFLKNVSVIPEVAT